ncbi:MAG: DUF2961 domain-containing protein [Phycisphaerae bacterium]|nr:DUF2961 domain-containing protein [Phycisphaerae bacterium]
MRSFILSGACISALVCPALAQDQITQADLLRRVIDLERLTTPPSVGEQTGLFSSYDRRSRIDKQGNYVAWHADDDCGHFLRVSADGWHVMAEMEGPGALTRIWSASPRGDIRFILDGEAVIDTQCDELLSGRLTPFEGPLVFRGLNCYFPIGFNRSCQVLCREKTLCYQINFVRFPRQVQVERFKSELDEAARAALEEVKTTLEKGFTDDQLFGGRRTMPIAVQQDLGPGEVLSETVEGAGTVRALYVALTDRVNPRELYALHRCLLRVYYDGAELPSVEAPLIDFFGSGFDLVSFRSLAVGTNKKLPLPLPDRHFGHDRFMYCYFPMPYRNGLRVEIENLNTGKRKIGLLLHMRVDLQPPAADALRFFARFRREDPCETPDYPLLETTGRGRLVGCVLNVDCPRAAWWGAGDDKVWIDGEKFPSYFGTGTEHYLGDAAGLRPLLDPLVGATRTGPYGKNSAYRWHIPDVVNFQKSIRFALGNRQPEGVQDTYYSSVVYWYAEPGGKHFFEPLTAVDLTLPGLRIPGAIEVEDTIVSTDWGNLVKQKYAGGAELSGETAASISTTEPVQINIHSPQARIVLLKLRTNPRRPFETITFTDADGQTIGTVEYSRAAEGMYTVGQLRLKQGNNRIILQCSRTAMLDCWLLEELPEGKPPATGGRGSCRAPEEIERTAQREGEAPAEPRKGGRSSR